MVGLYIIAGIILFFAVILFFNISLRVIYSPNDINIYAKIGFYKIHIIPGKPKKPEKPEKKKFFKLFKKKKRKPDKTKKEKKKDEKDVKEIAKKKKKLNISAIISLVKNIAVMMRKKLKKYLKIKIYGINAHVASADACKTAMLYGTVTQSAYYIYEFLDNNFKIAGKTKDNIKIIPDFTKESFSFDIDVKIYIRLAHILNISIAALIIFLKFRNKLQVENTTDTDTSSISDTAEKIKI